MKRNTTNESVLSIEPVNLYSKLFRQIDQALASMDQGIEVAQAALSDALKSWDKEQAYESYLLNKITSGAEVDVPSFSKIIKRKNLKYFNRTLAKLGLNELLAQSIKLGYNDDPTIEAHGSVYFSVISPALEEFGVERFIELLLFLREEGIVKINGLHNILMNKTIIEKSKQEKRDLVRRLMNLGFIFYRKRSEEERINDTITKISLNDLLDENWMELFGFAEFGPLVLQYLEQLKSEDFSTSVQTLLMDEIPPAYQRELVFKILENSIIQEIGFETILKTLNEITGRRISDSYYFIYDVAFRLIDMGYEQLAIEYIQQQKILLKQYAQTEQLSDWIAPTTENRIANLKILRGQDFQNYSDIRNSLFVFRNLDYQNSYPRYILDFFNSTYPAIYSSEYISDLKHSRKNLNPRTAIDFYYELQFASIIGDVAYWKQVFTRVCELAILDERHAYTGFSLAENTSDETFWEWLLSIYPEEFKYTSYFLSAQIDHAILKKDYGLVSELLITWYQGKKLIREEEVVGIARNAKPDSFNDVLRVFSELDSVGIKIPGKAITSLCERFSTRNDEASLVKCINDFADNVGSDIAYSELQLILLYTRQNRLSEARVVADSILRRDIDKSLRGHIQRFFADTSDKSVNEIFDALKFEFAAPSDSPRKVTYQRSTSGLTRSRDIVRDLKSMYDDLCQICRVPLETPFGRISEAAHIQGLGHPHNGPDEIVNLICLCPNHHKVFDSSGFYFTDDFKVINTMTGEVIGQLHLDPDHLLRNSCIKYQRGYAIASKAKKSRKWL